MFTRGGRSLRGRPQTIRHREAASSEKTSGGTTDLANRMQRLLVDEKLQDVTFSVGEGQRKFRANSYVLAAASKVFYVMFFSDFERETVVDVPDGTPEAFNVLLEYIHTDEAKLTLDNFNDVLYLAQKYMVDGLCGKVSSFVRQNLHVSNIFDFLAASEVYAEYENICLDFIDENAEEVLNSDGFADVDESRLKVILARDSLNAAEIVVWYQTIHWAERKLLSTHEEPSPEAIRKTLGDLLYLERLEIYEWFAMKKARALFVTRPRRSIFGVTRFRPWDDAYYDDSDE
ncbi:BTB/POZ domain-containing protein 6 [Aphelenchoides avenae]|nr:BTB/POZ domain-containing protein 6 [Aphelenchus avenae]